MRMNFENKYVSELIEIREVARINKDWELSDNIRNYLDTKFSFVFDTMDGQVIYHELKGQTRQNLINRLNNNARIENIFDSWLFTINSKK